MVVRSKFIIERKDGVLATDEIVIDSEGLTIGRLTGNDLLLNHRAVSRIHAGIKGSDGKYWLFNLSQANGTLLNGSLLDTPSLLEEGDLIQIGPYLLAVGRLDLALTIRVEIDPAVDPVAVQAAASGGLHPGTALLSERFSEEDQRALDLFWMKRSRESGEDTAKVSLTPKQKRGVSKAQYNWRPTLDLREQWRKSYFVWGGLAAFLFYSAVSVVSALTGEQAPAAGSDPTTGYFGGDHWYIWAGIAFMFPVAIIASVLRDTSRRRASLLAATRKVSPDSEAPSQPRLRVEDPPYPHPNIDPIICIGCRACVEACPHDVIAMVNGIAIPVALDQCMEDTSCQLECPTSPKACVVVNTTKVTPHSSRKPPARDQRFMTNVEGIYLIGDVSGTPLIKNAINEGGRVIDHIAEDLSREGYCAGADYDVAIIGLGPAGLSAAVLACQRGIKYIALEKDRLLSTIQTYQAGKFVFYTPADMPVTGGIPLITSPTNPNGDIKEAMLRAWSDAVTSNNVRINEEEPCVAVKNENGFFEVVTERGPKRDRMTYKARKVVIAIGNRGEPMKLRVPGEELRMFVQPEPERARFCPKCGATKTGESFDCASCGEKLSVRTLPAFEDSKVKYKLTDPETYSNKKCMVVAAGNSGVEAAVALAGLERRGDQITFARNNDVTIVVRSDFKNDITLRNKMDLYDCMDAGRIEVYYQSTIKEIKENEVILEDPRTGQEKARIMNDYVFAFLGSEKSIRFLENLGIRWAY
jgi:thioredoxin reductase/pSer/pThr/pTyr-binding forkhead associated (FHA) protein